MQENAQVTQSRSSTFRPMPAYTVEQLPLSPRSNIELWESWTKLTATVAPFLRAEFLALERPLLTDGEPLVVTASRDGKLAGVLPLLRHGRELESFRSEHAPEFDYVGDPEALDSIWHTLVERHDWDRLVLRGVPAASPLAIHLPGMALRDFSVTVVRPSARSPFIALPGFEHRLSAKLRQNVRRCARKLGVVELERVQTYSRALLDEGLALEAMAWKGSAGTSIASSRRLHHFYHALARLSARRGELDLYFLRADGRRIAFLYALDDGRNLYALKVGYDPAYSRFSPGHVLFAEVAREAEQRGLLELDFLGHNDEWKQRWTNLTRDHVVLDVHRLTARGAVSLVGRELVKPRIPTNLVQLASRARDELERARRRCQFDDIIGTHSAGQRIAGRVAEGFGIRSGIRRVLSDAGPPKPAFGAASRFRPGDWVEVADEQTIRDTLDGNDKLRGLIFVPSQWTTVGRRYRVQKLVRRIVDDHGELRPVSGTVLLEGVTCDCGGDDLGCGLHCPLMYRDEWLIPAEAPAEAPTPDQKQWATVRSVSEIEATLDRNGRRDGVSFLPEMERFAGKRFPVIRRLADVFEYDRWTGTRGPVYLLEGTECSGSSFGDAGPCDRACTLRWHGDWLALDPTD